MKTKLTVMFVAAMMLVASQGAWAQPGPWNGLAGQGRGLCVAKGMGRAMGMGRGVGMMACSQSQMFPPHLLPMMTVALELNAAQIEKISTLEQELRNTFEQQYDLKAEQRALMMPSAQGTVFNDKALREGLDSVMKQKVDLLVRRAELRDELAQVLSAEQREKCQAIMTSMMAPGPGRGMPFDGNRPRRGFAGRK
ncbi:Spy/CpxP family protein refolding chaperone [uncultured Desulfuromonas sp.]|uniref:Spy/CpxP family protein refolding chaperone n=1 Tax=uncultured Desulfuromonas sp. TaxID=181013 RepID=UPI002AAAEDF1|nr:Spy/CpxP family protein refolding chaperone [uncultured Desulfuromonas sp.]